MPLTIRELLITSNLVPFDTSYIAHYVGVPLVVLIAWMLIDRVVAAARAAAVSEIARARAAFDERLRITQDMHDGLGLQLNAALHVVERGDQDRRIVSDSLRACLDELRLIVDSSASGTGEFLPLLANLRYRLQPKLEAIGLQVQWRMANFPDDLCLPPGLSLQILRMVQEAINNTIKHAQASVIEFEAIDDSRSHRITLILRDNGRGFPPAASPNGKGLSGMRRRAGEAGVALHIRSSAAGTQIQIEIPDPRFTHHPPAGIEGKP